jgi:undecaprenyl phosphate N,N'-diacetylbacillosamine 1-phosphate transferase
MKRFFDITVSLTLLILLVPFWLIFGVLLCIKRWNQLFFTQLRIGKNNRSFLLYKLKTMNDLRDSSGKLLPDKQRLTAWGSFLRKTSLDEIPQLWNVIKGDMSIVGPRPLLPQYLPLYSERQARRHEVRPGITGWAQVNGRNAISWKQKFEYDLYYVENQSFMLDLKILFLTVYKVLKSKDIDSNTNQSVKPFTGNEQE